MYVVLSTVYIRFLLPLHQSKNEKILLRFNKINNCVYTCFKWYTWMLNIVSICLTGSLKIQIYKKKIKNNKNKLSCCLLRLLLTQLSVCVTRFTQSKNHFFFIKLKNMQQKFRLKPKICYNEKFQIVFRWQNTWIVRWVWIESG